MRQRIGPTGMLKMLRQHFPSWLEQSPEMPQLVHDALMRVRDLDRKVGPDQTTLQLLHNAEQARQRRQRRLVLAGLCLGGAWLTTQPIDWMSVEAIPAQGWILVAAAGWLFFRPGRN